MRIERLVAVPLVALVAACGGGGHEAPRLERAVLTPQTGSYENWGYAPDGGRLAYIRSDGRKDQLWTAAPDGSEARQLFAAADFWRDLIGWRRRDDRRIGRVREVVQAPGRDPLAVQWALAHRGR